MLYHNLLSKTSHLAIVAGCVLSFPAIAHAQDSKSDSESERTATSDERIVDDLHDRRLDPFAEIVVSAQGLRQFDLLAGTSVLEGTELQANLQGQLGEVLTKIPGVSATGFAPGASRPILRGFSGERVKVLVDGIGAIDVSNTSADHAVSIDPLTAESIEVLRGPAVLLFGSQAIGGAVNVIDKRIPRRIPDEPVHVDAIARADTASDLREFGASIDAPIGAGFVVHVDGSWRESDDLEVPGFVVSEALRAELLEEAAEEEEEGEFEEAEELREAAEQRGILPNSATETWTANGGISFFRGDSSLGVAVGVYDTRYGIPGRPGAGHHHGEEEGEEEEAEEEEGDVPVSIDLRQWRADLRGELDLGDGPFEKLRTRVGYSDYTHTEFEGDEVGTVFEVQGIEARAELVQNDRGKWRGSLGGQFYFRDFDAFGAEAYVAPNRTEQLAAFALQEYGNGPIQLEGSARFEATSVENTRDRIERDFDTFSGAIGLAYDGPFALRSGINVSRVARAPSAEELFSNGPHIATQAFEIGDPDLEIERAWGVELFSRGKIGTAEFSLAVFKNWFDNYIYLSETGEEEDDLPVFIYLQDDADYFGIEGEISYLFYESGSVGLTADMRGEYVRAELDDGTPLPQIPPLSLLGALDMETNRFDLRAEVQWFDSQNRVAEFETPTDSFTLVNASLTWRPFERDTIALVLSADNIFDVTGRRHASFTKDFVPLAGRNFKVSARASF
ncbi:TonB-dependent receptor [Altererythrobacter sp. MF3-039]|uniref:TonB-dependent receptor n=1 Tax=Altererythrobacter sp. MF3-039 TaxID=3252901 RepID=UPI00390C53FF